MTEAKKIKLSRTLRSAIYQAARKCVSGASPLFEAGLRIKPNTDHTTMNMRLVDDNTDLWDLETLARLKEIEFDDQGLCELDLYARTTQRSRYRGTIRELECNVYVLVSAEKVIWATSDERERARLAGEPWEGF